MFAFLKKKPVGDTVVFTISGMHCTSCSLLIDGELEDLAGVVSATTSYAHSTTTVIYDRAVANPEQMKKIIAGLGYEVVQK